MNILIILAHPEPKSMNGAMYNTAIETLKAAGHEVKTTDLYAAGFNPVSDRRNFLQEKNNTFFKQQLEELYAVEVNGFAADIETEQQKVEWCDLMIWQFPLWWFSVPAILKGWVDRVFAMGRFYGQDKIYENGVFKGKKALLSVTSGGKEAFYQKNTLYGDMLTLLKPIHRGIFEFTGFGVLQPHLVFEPARRPEEERTAELAKWRNRLLTIAEETTITTTPY